MCSEQVCFLLPTELCCKDVGGSRQPDSGPSEENGRRIWREGDPEHPGVHGSGHGCIQVSPPHGLWEEEGCLCHEDFLDSPLWEVNSPYFAVFRTWGIEEKITSSDSFCFDACVLISPPNCEGLRALKAKTHLTLSSV